MGPGARWGSISNQALSQRDGPGWLGAAICLAISRDLALARSHPNKASGCHCCKPFRSRIGFRLIKVFFRSLGSVFHRLCHLTFMERCWVRLMPPLLLLSCFLPPRGVAVRRHPQSPTGDGATRPAFVPPPPRLASSHSFLRARTIAVRTAVSRCPARRLPTCIANSLPATVVTSGLRPC